MYSTVATPLNFLKLLAHTIRWRLLLALARSDQRVNELVRLTKQPPNLVSYHLKRLRQQHLVSEHRSSADGRDVYYRLDLDKFHQLYLATGQAMHPAFGEPSQLSEPHTQSKTSPPARVLFLCTHNSARSQMAEGILRQLGGSQVEVFSAGSEPTDIHPLAVQTLRGMRIDIGQQRAKHLQEFTGQAFDYIVTVCDRVREGCPTFPGDPEQIHWSFSDPTLVEGPARVREQAFLNTARELNTRIQYLLLMIERDRKEKP